MTKYTIRVIKIPDKPEDAVPNSIGVMRDHYETSLFTADMTSDDAIEILSHLHDLVQRRLREAKK